MYTQGLFTPQIHGEIQFALNLEVEDGFFKYTFTDFVFQYYQRNRYGRYAPIRGKKKPLEVERFAGMQETWEEHKQFTRKVMENHIKVLKETMKQMPMGARDNYPAQKTIEII